MGRGKASACGRPREKPATRPATQAVEAFLLWHTAANQRGSESSSHLGQEPGQQLARLWGQEVCSSLKQVQGMAPNLLVEEPGARLGATCLSLCLQLCFRLRKCPGSPPSCSPTHPSPAWLDPPVSFSTGPTSV